ncbi:hypothetical protein AOLI_G00125980 [Acnodon oligacanthus]
MDSGTKLEELQLTTDEIKRLSYALKDEKFRQMLHEYAEEIAKPENKKKYEEEITQLEQERGMNVQFIHPKPHHVLKTSVNGKEKCFINICSNDLIGKPTCEAGRGKDGRVGQHWSLPYSLAPGRSDRDAKGNKCTIYDVIFHPDTLYIADTAPNEKPNAAPPQDQKSPIKESSLAPRQPTEPRYSVKYRSVVDLQDYRCSRDSAPGPRPKEIIVTIDLPLIKSAGGIDLNVTERCLVLESQKPAYKLELQLSYPVDDDKGHAKFNKTKKQLTITLPVLPAKESPVAHPEGKQLVSDEEERDGRGSADRAEGESSRAVDVLSMCEEASAETCISEKNSTDETEDCLLPGPVFCTSKMSSKHHSTEHTGSCSSGQETVSSESSSQQPIQKSLVESSVVSVGSSQLNSTLDEGTIKTVSLPEETGMLAEEEVVNSSPEQIRPTSGNKDIVFSSFTKKVEAQLKEQVDSVHSSEQSKTEFNMKTPALLREKNPEDGSEVIISDHATSAGLPFQNSLWFELD